MARLTIPQTYQLLRDAGFSQLAAAQMTAIAIAESGLRTDARGDVGIQTAVWGPSVGLFQVRTLKADTGTGRTRDVDALMADPRTQARAAYEISKGGTNFTPWSTWKHNSAQAQMPKVLAALGVSSTAQLPGKVTAAPLPSAGGGTTSAAAEPVGALGGPLWSLPSWLFDQGAKVAGGASEKLLADAAGYGTRLTIFGGALAVGLALVTVGAWRAVAPSVQKVVGVPLPGGAG